MKVYGCDQNERAIFDALRGGGNHPDYVIAYLGDLGRDLPKGERLYWRSFNLAPEGSVSRATFTRDFMAEPTEPDQPDLPSSIDSRSSLALGKSSLAGRYSAH